MLKIAIFTGASPRHKRFVLEVESHFSDQVDILWVVSKGCKKNKNSPTTNSDKRKELSNYNNSSKTSLLISKFNTLGFNKAFRALFYNFISKLFKKPLLLMHALFIRKSEKHYYPDIDIKELIQAKKIVTDDPNSKEIIDLLLGFSPDLFISFGGPIYKKQLYGIAKVSLNQHAGISPFYKGSYTTEQAILKSDYEHVGITIHHISELADEGAIIKTQRLHMNEFDSPAKIFVRNCALGNELLIETIEEYKNNKNISGFIQQSEGKTYFAKDMGASQLASLYFNYFIGYQRSEIRLKNNEN